MAQHDIAIGPYIVSAGATSTYIRMYLSSDKCSRFTYELSVQDPLLGYEHVFKIHHHLGSNETDQRSLSLKASLTNNYHTVPSCGRESLQLMWPQVLHRHHAEILRQMPETRFLERSKHLALSKAAKVPQQTRFSSSSCPEGWPLPNLSARSLSAPAALSQWRCISPLVVHPKAELECMDVSCREIRDQEDEQEAEEEDYETDARTEGYDGEDEEEFDDGDDDGGAADDDLAGSHHIFQQDEPILLQQLVPSSDITCSIHDARIRRPRNPLSYSYNPKDQRQYESDADSTAMESGMTKQASFVDAPSTTDSGHEDLSNAVNCSNANARTQRRKHCAWSTDSSDTETDAETDAETEQMVSPRTKLETRVPESIQSPAADTCRPRSRTSFPVSTRSRNRLAFDEGFLLEEVQGAPLFARRKRMLELIDLAQIPLMKSVEVTRSPTPVVPRTAHQQDRQGCNDESGKDGLPVDGDDGGDNREDRDNEDCHSQGLRFPSAALAPLHSVMLPCDICQCEFLITGQNTVMDFAKHKQ
ncbi:hypothetical protein BGZ72_000337 [Mortierella alpina]|nr:hypothetical protein BGZ72_000337 [Mortierella alpina]